MSYSADDFARDFHIMCKLAKRLKPNDIFDWVQWEMARTHKAIIQWWIQVEKVEIHHQVEEEIQFPALGVAIDTSASHAEYTSMLVPLGAFKSYLESVSEGTAQWSSETASMLAQAFLPELMHHFVEELYMLDPGALRRSGIAASALEAMRQAVAVRAKESADFTKDIPGLVVHNDGAFDWPRVPWAITDEFRMPAGLYLLHKGWWKYSALPLDL
ncbi:hypothetical protein WOLCODRAFT_158436 [Wolfiporia cocos MD-104 SS10]|uniref:Hemerythrin-like domain-containing protein n=1 Tax=Wolfiporia cocos (strain MD-104) TaxID=742152 RepID=A0A2H3JBE1_WOLCO|nr:hypothetical protein WOLCODRAFT_158436 [Wolfiporia cocos MD-104 SS10]